MEDNPFPAIMGRVCYHPCETSCNRGQLDEAVGINSVERFLGDEAIREGWRLEVEAEPTRQDGCSSSAPGPSGLSAAYHLARRGHAVTIREAGPMAGGMMRFGIPKYRLPRDVLDAEVAADPRPRGDARARLQGHRPARRDGGGRLRRRLPRGRRPASASAPTSPPARRRTCSTQSRCCTTSSRESDRCSAAGSRSTAAATRRWTRRGPRSASAPPRRSSSTDATATGCPRTSPRSPRPRRRGC